jgi:Leucine-rich repeat (LRR) protein
VIGDNSFAQLINLKYLTLAGNKLIKITAKTFVGLSKLEVLSLEDNQITEIEHGAFVSLSSLWVLNVDGNRLSIQKMNKMPKLITLPQG